ncbi:unnamed protein product [Soboliphyme baturini]|uniref:LEM domain-containing protein n=1 Tax=Soboliphyme baturini TaxID=241478 RepID=A0A183IQY0_9BILA|nr:unnamed protein product [Soboliphyme baturini]
MILYDNKPALYLILKSLDSRNVEELDAAIYAIKRFSMHCKTFSREIFDKVIEKMKCSNFLLENKVKLMPIFRYMYAGMETGQEIFEVKKNVLCCLNVIATKSPQFWSKADLDAFCDISLKLQSHDLLLDAAAIIDRLSHGQWVNIWEITIDSKLMILCTHLLNSNCTRLFLTVLKIYLNLIEYLDVFQEHRVRFQIFNDRFSWWISALLKISAAEHLLASRSNSLVAYYADVQKALALYRECTFELKAAVNPSVNRWFVVTFCKLRVEFLKSMTTFIDAISHVRMCPPPKASSVSSIMAIYANLLLENLNLIVIEMAKVPLFFPCFFFRKVQHTTVKLLISPAPSESERQITVCSNQKLIAKVEGIVTTREWLNSFPRRVSKVVVTIMPESDKADFMIRQTSNGITRGISKTVDVQNDYFVAEFALEFTKSGLMNVCIGFIDDLEHKAWKTETEETIRVKILKLLLLNGGDPFLTDNDGKTAYNYALTNDHRSCVRLIDWWTKPASAYDVAQSSPATLAKWNAGVYRELVSCQESPELRLRRLKISAGPNSFHSARKSLNFGNCETNSEIIDQHQPKFCSDGVTGASSKQASPKVASKEATSNQNQRISFAELEMTIVKKDKEDRRTIDPSILQKCEQLNDKQLGEKLREEGFNVGPISSTTRTLYQKTLASFWNCMVASEGKFTAELEALIFGKLDLTSIQSDLQLMTEAKHKKILELWRKDIGVIALDVFHNIIAVEAYTREAAMIDAIGLRNLENMIRGDYYGLPTTWSQARCRRLGAYLLKMASAVFLAEGEKIVKFKDVSWI